MSVSSVNVGGGASLTPSSATTRNPPERNASGGFVISSLKRQVGVHPSANALDSVPLYKPVGARIEMASQPFAEVRLRGKVIATLYNDGSGAVANSARLGRVPGPNDPQSGPDLAAWRAAQLVEANGGTVVRSPTAITQRAWDELPPIRWSSGEAFRALPTGSRHSVVA